MRLSFDEYFLNIAIAVSKRSNCIRRSVGCVLVDSNNSILSTGYNGTARGLPNCNDKVITRHIDHDEVVYPNACKGSNSSSGMNLDSCQSIHAEQNALLQCSNVNSIMTVYTTTEPCITCTKLLLATSAIRVVFLRPYPHSDQVKSLWLGSGKGRTWESPKTVPELTRAALLYGDSEV